MKNLPSIQTKTNKFILLQYISTIHIRKYSLISCIFLCFLNFKITFGQLANDPISPDGLLETVFDNYGNKYALSDIKIPDDSSSYTKQAITCLPSYFNLYFENGWAGSTANASAKEAVICQVLHDLSNFIVSPLTNSQTRVNIWVRNINSLITNPANSLVLGLATPFYCLPYNGSPNFGGIADNEIWKTIQSGTDSYTNVAAPLIMSSAVPSSTGLNYFHGQMAFNFENTQQVAWNLNLSNGSGNGQFDFYSTVLHEMIHALGFASTISSTGNSIYGNGFNYYTRYDLFLKNNSESASLIVNGGDPCDMYNYYPNPNLSPISNVLAPSTVNCNTAIHYVSNLNTNSVPVYTTNPHSYGNTSHFDDGCIVPSQTGQYFVMSHSVSSGPSNTKRALTNEERLALCDMGYQTSNSFGSSVANNITPYPASNCPGVKVAGINDGFIPSGPQIGQFSYIVLTGSNTITIPSTGTNGFLSNDHFSNSTNNSFSCPAIISGPGNIVSSSSAGIVFQSSPNTSQTGITLIRYIPIDGTGNIGNITYIYVLSTANMNCTAVCDNLVPNGDFESLTVTGQFPNASQQITRAACWDKANNGTPDLFNTNSPTPGSPNNVHVSCSWYGFQDPKPSTTNTYAGLVRRDSPNTNTHANEMIYTKLSQPLLPYTNYQFTMDASLAETFRLKSYNLQVLFTNQLGILGTNTAYTVLPTDILLPSPGNSFAITDVNIWTPITINFATGALTGGASYEFLVIGNIENSWGISQNPLFNTPNCNTWPQTLNKIDESYVFIDNISLRLQANVVTLNLPSAIGLNQVVQLSNFISPVWPGNGTFSSTNATTNAAIIGTGLNTTFNTAIAGVGVHVIDFKYINNLGCEIVLSDIITVDNCAFPDPQVSISSPFCENQPITATITNPYPGVTYSWQVHSFFIPNVWPLTGTCNSTATCSSFTFNYFPPFQGFNNISVSCNIPGCISTSTIINLDDIGVGACCINPNVTIDGNIKVSDSNFPIIHNGDVIFVKAGTIITVDVPYSLSDCRFYFESGAGINVAGKTLTLNGCHLQGCESMWKGISLLGTGDVVSNSSIVENAIVGISAGFNTSYTITNSIFNKNKTDVYVYGAPGNNTQFTGTIVGSVFTCRDVPHPTLSLPGSPTMYTFASILRGTNNAENLYHYPISTVNYSSPSLSRSGAGVLIDYIGTAPSSAISYKIKIGDASDTYTAKGNLFDNHDYGIRGNQSCVEVVNNKFQEMQGFDYAKNSTGIGIYFYNTSTRILNTKIGGYADYEANSFLNCGIGCLINGYTNALVVKNNITKSTGNNSTTQNYVGKFGIKFTNSLESHYECNANYLTNIFNAIEFAQIDRKIVQCNFNQNHILTNNISDNCNSSIFVHGPYDYPNFTNSFINISMNTLKSVGNGIRIENFFNIPLISVASNHEILLRYWQGWQYGVSVLNTNNVRILDNNNIHGTSRYNLNTKGIFLVEAQSSQINCNNIHTIGTCVGFNLSCQANNSIYQEGVLHNNTFSNYSTAIDFMSGSSVDNLGSASHASDNQWVSSIGGKDINNYSIVSLNNPFTIFYRNTNSNFYPNNIIPLVSSILTPVNNSSGVTCSSSNSSPSLTTKLSNQEVALIRMISENILTFPILSTELKWQYSNSLYSRIMNDTTISSNDSLVTDFRDSLQTTNIGKFYSLNEAVNNEAWAQAESDNQSISFQSHIEENLKKFNSYYLAYHSDTTLSSDSTWLANMIANLSLIASECYSIGGPATASARTMLSYFSNQIFDENQDCFKTPLDSIVADTTNEVCDLVKKYCVPVTANAIYTWTVPVGANYNQTLNSIEVNWGAAIAGGGTITCSVMDSLGNSAFASFVEDSLTVAPTCPTVTANNTSCITATTLNWNTTGCAAGYLVTAWTGTSTPNYHAYNLDVGFVGSYSFTALNPNTTYYYRVIPYDYRDSIISGCSIGSFTSGASQAVSPTLTNTITLGQEGVSTPSLPCGITVENYDGIGTSNWYTSTVAPRTGANHMRIDKNPDNNTSLDDWFFSPPINVSIGKSYRLTWFARIASGTTAETYKVYFGQNLPDASTMDGEGAPNRTLSTNTYIKDSIIDFLATSSGQIYFGIRATSQANRGSIYIDDIQIKEMQVTTLVSASCNTTLSSSNIINVNAVSGATNYQYKFVGTGGQSGYNYEHSTFNSGTSFDIFNKAPGVIYGYTYNVSASFKKNNIWSSYGASCPVTLSPFPQNKLTDNPATPGYCSYAVTDQHDLIGVTTIPGANRYQYKIVENDSTNNYTYDTTSTTLNSVGELRLDMTAISPKVRYDYYYNVQVRALVGSTNATYGNRPGEWGTYGPTCVVHVSGKPTTYLTAPYCNSTLTNLNDVFYIKPISAASNYNFHITAPGYSNTISTSNSNAEFRLTSIPTAGSPGGAKYGTTYSIKAAAYVGGELLPYGDSCTITTPNPPKTKLQSSYCNITLSAGQYSGQVFCNSIIGASNYQYRITGDFTNSAPPYTRVIYRGNSNNDFRFSWTNQAGNLPNMKPNTTYKVEASYYAGQWEAYGDSCTITTGSTLSREIDLDSEANNSSLLSLSVYPNPNNHLNPFSIEINGINESNLKSDIFIYNLLGEKLFEANVTTKEEGSLIINPEIDLPKGVYIIAFDLQGIMLRKKLIIE